MKQLEVTILGQSYLLGCPDGGEAALLKAVAIVDREMCAIRDAGKVKARERMAVLAALNLAYQLTELPGKSLAEQNDAPKLNPNAPDSTVLGKLIHRIDQALESDGQLL